MKMTKAPLYLFAFLGVMVCCIIASVIIALKNPVYEDDSYFASKKQVDEEINAILQEQNQFLKTCELYLAIDEPASFLSASKLIPPYLQSSTYSHALRIDSQMKHRLFLAIKGEAPRDLSIQLYLERINSSDARISLGDIEPQSPKILPHLSLGRYKAIFEVSYSREEKKRKVFFEKEIFVI